MKTKADILASYYVNKKDIERLLEIPRKKASAIFEEIDREEQKNPFRAHESKVPLIAVLNLTGVNYAFLTRQVRGKEKE